MADQDQGRPSSNDGNHDDQEGRTLSTSSITCRQNQRTSSPTTPPQKKTSWNDPREIATRIRKEQLTCEAADLVSLDGSEFVVPSDTDIADCDAITPIPNKCNGDDALIKKTFSTDTPETILILDDPLMYGDDNKSTSSLSDVSNAKSEATSRMLRTETPPYPLLDMDNFSARVSVLNKREEPPTFREPNDARIHFDPYIGYSEASEDEEETEEDPLETQDKRIMILDEGIILPDSSIPSCDVVNDEDNSNDDTPTTSDSGESPEKDIPAFLDEDFDDEKSQASQPSFSDGPCVKLLVTAAILLLLTGIVLLVVGLIFWDDGESNKVTNSFSSPAPSSLTVAPTPSPSTLATNDQSVSATVAPTWTPATILFATNVNINTTTGIFYTVLQSDGNLITRTGLPEDDGDTVYKSNSARNSYKGDHFLALNTDESVSIYRGTPEDDAASLIEIFTTQSPNSGLPKDGKITPLLSVGEQVSSTDKPLLFPTLSTGLMQQDNGNFVIYSGSDVQQQLPLLSTETTPMTRYELLFPIEISLLLLEQRTADFADLLLSEDSLFVSFERVTQNLIKAHFRKNAYAANDNNPIVDLEVGVKVVNYSLGNNDDRRKLQTVTNDDNLLILYVESTISCRSATSIIQEAGSDMTNIVYDLINDTFDTETEKEGYVLELQSTSETSNDYLFGSMIDSVANVNVQEGVIITPLDGTSSSAPLTQNTTKPPKEFTEPTLSPTSLSSPISFTDSPHTIQPTRIQTSALLKADFNGHTEGFIFEKDIFRSTNSPLHSSGSLDETAGVLNVNLGHDHVTTIFGVSGGWRKSFVTSQIGGITISLRYNLIQSNAYEPDEYSQVLCSLDGNLVGKANGYDYIDQIIGDGDGGDAISTGWTEVTVKVDSVVTGEHSFAVGCYSNKRTWPDEITNCMIDYVVINMEPAIELPIISPLPTSPQNPPTYSSSVPLTTSPTYSPIYVASDVTNTPVSTPLPTSGTLPVSTPLPINGISPEPTPLPTTVVFTSNPATASPTTSSPTTALPTTALPTTASPTTASPTTASPTTAFPTPPPSAFPTSRPPTNFPTQSPVGLNGCASEQNAFRVDITSDTYPEEILWELTEASSEQVLLEGGPYLPGNMGNVVSSFRCLSTKDKCYNFTITDGFGDGIIEPGGYELLLDGEVFESGGAYGEGESILFGSNCPEREGPTNEPTYGPTSEPTNTQAESILVEANFNNDFDGFTFSADEFRNTNNPSYSFGERNLNGGPNSDGSLQVRLGGVDYNARIGMSGGWRRSFDLLQDEDVKITFSFYLAQSSDYESNEFSQLLCKMDNTRLGRDGNDYIAQIVGDGNGGSGISIGWTTISFTVLNLPAGYHTFSVGCYNSQKSWPNEITTCEIDDVLIETVDY